jgi:hypothetical protein
VSAGGPVVEWSSGDTWFTARVLPGSVSSRAVVLAVGNLSASGDWLWSVSYSLGSVSWSTGGRAANLVTARAAADMAMVSAATVGRRAAAAAAAASVAGSGLPAKN